MAIAGRILIIPKGNYDASATYSMLDAVSYNDALWLAKKTATGITPSTANSEYWQKMIDVAGKQDAITGGATTITENNLTASRALVSDGNGKVAVSAVTATELGYLDGVTSNVQTQLNAKSATSHTHTTLSGLTATVAELNYMDGVTSSVQTQLNAKASSSHTHPASNVTAGTLAGAVVANTTAVATIGTKQIRNIYAGTAELTAGTSALTTGDIYIQYE